MALEKPTEQIGTLDSHGAYLAVDGDTNPVLDQGGCAHPFTGDRNDPPVPVWWYVDLEQSYRTTQVVLYNRASGSYSKRITRFISTPFYNIIIYMSGRGLPQCQIYIHVCIHYVVVYILSSSYYSTYE